MRTKFLFTSWVCIFALYGALDCGVAFSQGGGGGSDFIRRMDANGNGMIDPEESQGRARGMLERMAQSNPRINLNRPIPIDMLSSEMDRMRGGFGGGAGGGGRGGNNGGGGFAGGFGGNFGGGNPGSNSGGDRNARSQNNAQSGRQGGADAEAPVPTLVEGFGNQFNDMPVLGFGSDQEANLTGIKLTDEDTNRTERTLRQNDRNSDGVIEGEEISNGRWDDGDPKIYDSNRDGRLTRNELLIRSAKKRLADEAEAQAEKEQRGRDRDQRGGDRGGGRFGGFGGWTGGGEFTADMMGGGRFGGRGGFGGGMGGFGGGGMGGGMGGFGGGGIGGFGGGGMRFGGPGGEGAPVVMQFGDPSATPGGAPGAVPGGGGNMMMMMGGPGGEGGGGRGRGRGGFGGGGGGEEGDRGRGGFGGGGEENGEGGGRGRGRGGFGGGGGGEEGNDGMARLEGFFSQVDTNQSGSLEKEEWGGLRSVRGEDLDKDSNGVVSKQEYMEVVGERLGVKIDPARFAWKPNGPLTYRAKETKEKYPDVPTWFWNEDKNGDGQISMAERATTWTDERLAKWLKEDTNGDGMITMQEAVASLKPAASGLVIASPKAAAPAGAGAGVAAANGGDGSRNPGENRRSRNDENAAAPAIAPEVAKEMKEDRSKRWANAAGGKEGAAKEGAAATPAAASTELPADLPKEVDPTKAKRSMAFFNQKLDKNADGFLTADESEDVKDADKDGDGKISLKEWILFKNG